MYHSSLIFCQLLNTNESASIERVEERESNREGQLTFSGCGAGEADKESTCEVVCRLEN